jgi:hypothetical protein
LFPLFATGVNDTGGKFAEGFVDTGGNLSPGSLPLVSTTQAKCWQNLPPVVVYTVGKFAAGVVDTGVNFANLPSVTLVVHLDLRISPRIFAKIQNDLYVIFRGLGEGDS